MKYCLGHMGARLIDDAAPTTFSDPGVTYLSPSPGANTGPLPTIEARLQVGALPKSQISLDKLRATLDGADVKDLLRLDFEYAADPTADPFEVITVSFTPATPLADGQHTFTLDVPVHHYSGQGPGKTLASLTFMVVTQPPPPGTETLPVTRDALVYERGPHANEGTNPRLTLGKITGKAARNLLGFELTGVDNNALTKATLVARGARQPADRWQWRGSHLVFPSGREHRQRLLQFGGPEERLIRGREARCLRWCATTRPESCAST